MRRVSNLLFLGLLAACGETTDQDVVPRDAGSAVRDAGDVVVDRDGGSAARDAGSQQARDAGSSTRDAGQGTPRDGGSGGIDGGPQMTGTLVGNVTRSAEPAAGGVGHIYIGVFTADPVTDRDNAVPVVNVRVEDADMSSPNASIPYRLEGVPPRADPYFVTAFLDDNNNTMLPDAAPDRGDLVAIERLRAPQVTVATPTEVMFDIDLNINLPF